MRTVGATAAYHPSGRIRGSYVYMLLCRISDAVHIKIGLSDSPMQRLQDLLTACPITPEVMAVTELPNRKTALRLEQELHCALAKWRGAGEWFVFLAGDKAAFNALVRSTAAHFAKPSWPMTWTKVSVPALIADSKRRLSLARKRSHGRGRAYMDFAKESGERFAK